VNRIAFVLLACVLSSDLAHAQAPTHFHASEQETSLRSALQGSLRFLAVEHLFRVATQEKTRAELGGPFFRDYRRSARMPRQWGDGDGRFTNYVLHPLQGATSGYIWLESRGETLQPFARDSSYWHSRLRAMAWAAGYSMQFEIGPLSEASIGNVGMNSDHAGWVDHVMTPTGGFAVMLGEDMVDRFLLPRLEQRVGSSVVRAALRISLTPSRATANVMSLRTPWHRAERPIR
jgi:hypothetical protein